MDNKETAILAENESDGLGFNFLNLKYGFDKVIKMTRHFFSPKFGSKNTQVGTVFQATSLHKPLCCFPIFSKTAAASKAHLHLAFRKVV